MLCPVAARMALVLSNRVTPEALHHMCRDLAWWSRLREVGVVAMRPCGTGLFGPGLSTAALEGLSALLGLRVRKGHGAGGSRVAALRTGCGTSGGRRGPRLCLCWGACEVDGLGLLPMAEFGMRLCAAASLRATRWLGSWALRLQELHEGLAKVRHSLTGLALPLPLCPQALSTEGVESDTALHAVLR